MQLALCRRRQVAVIEYVKVPTKTLTSRAPCPHLRTEPVRPHWALALDVLVARAPGDMSPERWIMLHHQLCSRAGHLDAIWLGRALLHHP